MTPQRSARANWRMCEAHGLRGLFPLDAEPPHGGGAPPSRRIFEANVAALRSADAVVANLTPFRGVSADIGTVFEVGYAAALDKPVFAYANVADDFRTRIGAAFGPLAAAEVDGRVFAADDLLVEDFGLFDNLMVPEALARQGRSIVMRAVAAGSALRDLGAFELCLRDAASALSAHSSGERALRSAQS